ncbi:MAG: hypothetical protein JW818_02465 [Pirellulales bacterium]|nr:hypothetical protein [Pirellulales bacterium]
MKTLPESLIRHPLIAATALILSLLWAGQSAYAAKAKKDKLPSFAQVEEVVLRYFDSLPGYQPGGILARSEVEPVFDQLKMLGWRVVDAKAMLARVPADQDFLVQQLRTKKGRKFAAKIAGYPGGYDRIDRLTRIPNGRKLLSDLIRGKGGYELIEYMTSSQGGKNLGKLLGNVPKGADFNKPTGRIYTVKDLLAELKTRYIALTQPEKKPGAVGTR